jgi:methylthioribose-1-phosphate isomerase
MIESISYKNNELKILNQLKLPLIVEYVSINSTSDAWTAIHSMQVRGAPAIAILAILSIAVQLNDKQKLSEFDDNKDNLFNYLKAQCDYLCTSRPTAVNIKKECLQMLELAKQLSREPNQSFESMVSKLKEYALNILEIDVNVNKSIGDYGAKHIIAKQTHDSSKNILTHCNTGSLATGSLHYFNNLFDNKNVFLKMISWLWNCSRSH